MSKDKKEDNGKEMEDWRLYKYAIFDMDGTILDSMPYWENLTKDYIEALGYKAPEDLRENMSSMTVKEGMQHIKDLYAIDKSVACIEQEVLALIRKEYYEDIPVKGKIAELVRTMKNAQVKMCILTSSDYECACVAMKRTKLYDCFDAIFTSDRLGMTKRSGEIYNEVCRRMGYVPAETVVYEDAVHGVTSAKEAGCHVVAVYDKESEKDWEIIQSIADESIYNTEY